MHFDHDLGNVAPPALPILVAKWDSPIRAILICRDWAGVRTHWFGGHTIACCGTLNCPACEANQSWVKKFYIVGTSPSSGNSAILMLTPLAAEGVAAHRHKDRGLLGMEILLGRSAKRNTSPMIATVVNYHPQTAEFGEQRLLRVVTRIFRENAGVKS